MEFTEEVPFTERIKKSRLLTVLMGFCFFTKSVIDVGLVHVWE